MAIAMRKLAAGSGYEYLTQQVAALDATDRSRGTLAECYGAQGEWQGEWPGEWDGGGLEGVSLATGDLVTNEQ